LSSVPAEIGGGSPDPVVAERTRARQTGKLPMWLRRRL